MTPAELQAWRKQADLTQAALAELLGVDAMTVSRWERGKRAIPPFLHLALESLIWQNDRFNTNDRIRFRSLLLPATVAHDK